MGARGSDLHITGRVAYTTDGAAVYRIDLDTFTVSVIVDGLAGEWFGGEPELAVDPSRRALFGLKGRNLVRIAIDGR